ncbi:hypothetical protein AB6A40_001901 [Gnathostoma spinigerum]|uniref:EF-hand domain-containing protein n=1 Tax=Gnathostoma spinigerum TaxID=75299 RepID=A0ABD6E7F2_9BILA
MNDFYDIGRRMGFIMFYTFCDLRNTILARYHSNSSYNFQMHVYLLFPFMIVSAIAFGNIDLTEIRFSDVDSDSDNTVTYIELEKWFKKNTKNFDELRLKQKFKEHDTAGDGAIKLPDFVAFVGDLSKESETHPEAVFRKFDINGDAVLTREEAAQSVDLNGLVDKVFDTADVNRDNQLTLNEFLAVFVTSTPRRNRKIDRSRELADRLLFLIDLDGNHKLDPDEIYRFANLNAKVSKEEIITAFKALDSNHDGLLSADELAEVPDKFANTVRFREAPLVKTSN